MLRLNSEDILILLASRIYLEREDDALLVQLVEKPLDWPYIIWQTEHHKCLPILLDHLQRLNLFEAVPKEILWYIQAWTRLSKTRSVEQFRELGTILDTLNDAKIEHFILKGSALAGLYFPDPLTRPMQDVDVMIHPKDAKRAQKTMYSLGYRHGIWNPGTARFTHMFRRITPSLFRSHYELPSFTKVIHIESPLPSGAVPWGWRKKSIKCHIDDKGRLSLPIFADLHFNLSAGMDTEDVWRGASQETVLGKTVRVQSPTAMVWFLAARLYNEAFQYSTLKLAMFGDIHAVLYKQADSIDWAEILVIAHKYGMHPALFYVLSQLKALTNSDVPDNALELLRPNPRKPPMTNDWGDVLPKLLSIPAVHDVKLA
jgi:putative nucleotidyltransferase-like protein